MKAARPLLKWVVAPLALVFIAIQFVPVSRTNPPVEAEMPAPVEVRAILQRACYDCHSHETEWPWYGYVAPASWLVASDVAEAREELNFSTWNSISNEEQIEVPFEIWEEVEEGEMPLWFYVLLHRDARLSDKDRAVLRNWTLSNDEGE